MVMLHPLLTGGIGVRCSHTDRQEGLKMEPPFLNIDLI